MHAASRDGRAVLATNPLLIVDPQAMPGPYRDRATGVLLTFNLDSSGAGRWRCERLAA